VKVEHFGTGFPILAAVSLVEAIDAIEGLEVKASIKWVNDVLCDGAKVAGFLVHTTSMEDTVSSVVLGIGLNVEKTPELPPDPHVPKVASIREFVEESIKLDLKAILSILLDRLSENYRLLLQGQWAQLLNVYRKRSFVIGREVRILSDPEEGKQEELGSGKVFSIGENLEIWLDGEDNPVKKGRLIVID
jgi:BirA family biotin operon repressor/biotin-[acetyl-CoA-carboxylase] ligase